MAEAKVTIKCNSEPLLTFIELFNLGLQSVVGLVNVGDSPSEIIRIEQNPRSAGTNEVIVQLYPSDAFLRYAATVFTGKLNFGAVNDSRHKTSKVKEP